MAHPNKQSARRKRANFYGKFYAHSTRNKKRRWQRNQNPKLSLRKFQTYEDEVAASGGRILSKRGD